MPYLKQKWTRWLMATLVATVLVATPAWLVYSQTMSRQEVQTVVNAITPVVANLASVVAEEQARQRAEAQMFVHMSVVLAALAEELAEGANTTPARRAAIQHEMGLLQVGVGNILERRQQFRQGLSGVILTLNGIVGALARVQS